uniref:Uncharacterized protein n=1 Tax=Anolis carolinensis TaxID=28377 RepID=H9GCS6_ANOCA
EFGHIFWMLYDSIGKPSSNVLGGNTDRLGSYTECISTEAPSGKFQGQYCKLQVLQVCYSFGMLIVVLKIWLFHCFSLRGNILRWRQKFKTISFLLPFPSPFALNSTVSFTQVARCTTGLFSIDAFVGVCLLKLDTVLKHRAFQEYSTWNNVLELIFGFLNSSGTLDFILKCFSLQKNLPALWVIKPSQDLSLALNGIRTLSLLWIISGHTSQMTAWQNLDNELEWEAKVLKNPVYIYSLSGPFYLGVDTFFLISGLLSSWSFINLLNCSGENLGFHIILKYLWSRLVRLQPLHMYSVCLLVGLYSIIPWGPLWEYSKLEVDNCRNTWWSNIFLINNFICNGWTWYLANDFQFHFTTPLLVFFSTQKHWLIISVTFLFLATFTVTALLSSVYRLPVANPHDMRKTSTVMYFMEYYSKPYCRYGPFLVGIILGLFIYHQKMPVLRTKMQAFIGWLCAMFSMFIVVLLAYALDGTSKYYSPAHALYQAIHRTVWAAAVGWIIFACKEGYGGFINGMLSWGIWTVAAKISYACYLVHPMLILLYNGLQETFIHYSDINMFYLFLGHCLLTFVVGLALTVMVEMPLRELKWSLACKHQEVPL